MKWTLWCIKLLEYQWGFFDKVFWNDFDTEVVLWGPTPWTPDPQPTHPPSPAEHQDIPVRAEHQCTDAQRLPAAERSSVPWVSLRSEREAWTLKVSEVLDSFYFFELIST